MERLRKSIIKHEGLRLAVYDDASGKPIKAGDTLVGHPTIGVGRLLDERAGISQAEAEYLLDNDINRVVRDVNGNLPWLHRLNDVRRDVLYEMAFQMGVKGLLGFVNTLALIEGGKYEAAASAMLNSKWAKQTPARAKALSLAMLNG